MKYSLYSFILALLIFTSCRPTRTLQPSRSVPAAPEVSLQLPPRESKIHPGAERTRHYFNKLKHDRKIGVLANQTSLIYQTHLVDSMLASGISVVKVFSSEHGFRGTADAGSLVNNEIDSKTGLPIISLYGNHKKPTPEDLKGLDLMVVDLQDVGTRFYTYISTMALVMEACAESSIPVLVLDRPNPNGFYVDGPMLESQYKSFVGMHPVPVVHGMTMAEYARMVNDEGWLTNGIKCDLDWVACSGYNHERFYDLPVKPSPNLPDMASVILYPSLCFFEGTKVSIGRGTETPFTVIGYPGFKHGTYSFTPTSRPGAMDPPYKNQLCQGYNLHDSAESIKHSPGIRLHWLIDLYKADSSKSTFFTSYFNTLAGNGVLRQQIEDGMSESDIRSSWQPDLQKFKATREKYLLYRDFE